MDQACGRGPAGRHQVKTFHKVALKLLDAAMELTKGWKFGNLHMRSHFTMFFTFGVCLTFFIIKGKMKSEDG